MFVDQRARSVQLAQQRAAADNPAFQRKVGAVRETDRHLFDRAAVIGRQPGQQLSAKVIGRVVATLPLREQLSQGLAVGVGHTHFSGSGINVIRSAAPSSKSTLAGRAGCYRIRLAGEDIREYS